MEYNQEVLENNQDCKIAFVNVNQGCEQRIAQIIAAHNYFPYVLISKWHINDYAALGARGFLFKPISIQKLQDIIDLLINEQDVEKKESHELHGLREQLRFMHPDLLIAEDNHVNKMLLDSILGIHATIISVDDGEMAVASCNDRKYDIILLDLHMPKLNGLEAAQLIRQKSQLNQYTPIVLISANSNELSSKTLQNAGVDFYLQKPIDERYLLMQILRILNKSKHAAIDWQLCVQKVSGNQKLAAEFLMQFVEELQKNREEFIQLMHQKEIKKLGEAAHKLHGACCFTGVPTLQKNVILIEKMAAHSASPEELAAPFAELIQSIDAVINEYKHQPEKTINVLQERK